MLDVDTFLTAPYIFADASCQPRPRKGRPGRSYVGVFKAALNVVVAAEQPVDEGGLKRRMFLARHVIDSSEATHYPPATVCRPVGTPQEEGD